MCKTAPEGQKVIIETNYGDIKVILYDDTPIHKNNFIELAKENFYNDLTFHRVIKGFMIQGGDSKSSSDSISREMDKKNLLPAEFRFPKYYHKSGALAAARWGTDENPEKKSDAFQFYIISGSKVDKQDIQNLEKRRIEQLKQNIYQQMQAAVVDTIKQLYREAKREELAALKTSILEKAEIEAEARKSEVIYTDEQKEVYTQIGGAPHLDGEYTVFGEVYEGMDVVKKIETVETNAGDKPLKPVVIKKVSLIN